jgi:hypothetical protein
MWERINNHSSRSSVSSLDLKVSPTMMHNEVCSCTVYTLPDTFRRMACSHDIRGSSVRWRTEPDSCPSHLIHKRLWGARKVHNTYHSQPISCAGNVEKQSNFLSRNRDYGCRDPSSCPRGNLYPQKLALSSPTSGGRSVVT